MKLIRWQKNCINVDVVAFQLSLKDVLFTTNLPSFTGIRGLMRGMATLP